MVRLGRPGLICMLTTTSSIVQTCLRCCSAGLGGHELICLGSAPLLKPAHCAIPGKSADRVARQHCQVWLFVRQQVGNDLRMNVAVSPESAWTLGIKYLLENGLSTQGNRATRS